MPLITSIIIKIVRNLCYGNTHLMFFLRKTTGPMAHPWETGSNKLTFFLSSVSVFQFRKTCRHTDTATYVKDRELSQPHYPKDPKKMKKKQQLGHLS